MAKWNPGWPWNRDSFHQQILLKFKEETSEEPHLKHDCLWCWNVGTSETFWNVVLERAREDRLCENWRSTAESQKDRNIVHTIKRRKAIWTGHILHANCLLKFVIKGKIEGRIDVTGRRGRWREQLLDDLKEKRGYWKLKEDAPDRTVWRTRFGRGYGLVAKQTTDCYDMYVRVWHYPYKMLHL
jgi:hypothetical protein